MGRTRLNSLGFAIAAFVACASTVRAYDRFSVNADPTNCRACHGDFRANNYVSAHDGQPWSVTVGTQTYTSLHDVHRRVMLNSDCSTCHSSGGEFPVLTSSSEGGLGFQPIGCAGCHGRTGDHNPPATGYSAGLRQHHARSGVTVCMNCHDDANPANYRPVAERVQPPYYFTPDANHPSKPTDACNTGGVGENVAGGPTGLDNDGNGVYDFIDCDTIFRDGFQSNPLVAWTPVLTDGGDLSVGAVAGPGGTSLGMQSLVNGQVILKQAQFSGACLLLSFAALLLIRGVIARRTAPKEKGGKAAEILIRDADIVAS